MTQEKRSYLGQGPKMFRPAVAWMALSGLVGWLLPSIFLIPSSIAGISLLFGVVFVFIGAALYLWGSWCMIWAVKSDALYTAGPFSLVRHPMYSAWILFLFPGIALIAGVWPMLASSLVAWAMFKKHMPAEEQEMINEYGPAYEEYKIRVPALVPNLLVLIRK